MAAWRAILAAPLCMAVRPWLSSVVDGELRGKWWARVVTRHVGVCEPCAHLLERLREVKMAVIESAAAVAPPPPTLWQAIERRLADAPARYPARFAPVWVPVGIALVGVVTVTAVLLLRQPSHVLSAEVFRRHYAQALRAGSLGDVEVRDPTEAQQWAQSHMTVPTRVLPSVAGLPLTRVGTLETDGGQPAAYFVYARQAEPTVIYVHKKTEESMPPWDRHETPHGSIYLTSSGEVSLACWEVGDLTYIAVGRQPLSAFAVECLEAFARCDNPRCGNLRCGTVRCDTPRCTTLRCDTL